MVHIFSPRAQESLASVPADRWARGSASYSGASGVQAGPSIARAADVAVGVGTAATIVTEESVEDEDEEQRPKRSMWNNQAILNTFVAGGLAGAASRTVVSPLERLKIILQVQPQSPSPLSRAATTRAADKAYNGVWSSLVRMYKEEGLKGYMKGNGINCARIFPYSAIQFTSYGAFKNLLGSWSGQTELSTPLRLTAGAAAGICSVVTTYPLDLVRSRLSIATASISSAKGAAGGAMTAEDALLGIVGMTKKVYRTEGGLKGLYRGVGTTAAGVAPYVSLNFYAYENLKGYFVPTGALAENVDAGELAVRKLICGGLAGTISQTLTYPFDVLRRKMQVAGLSTLGPQYTGAFDAMFQIIKSEGWWGGMYRGIWPNLLKVAPSIAVSFYVFETVKDGLAELEAASDDD